MNQKIAVVGEADSILLFRAVGVETHCVQDGAAAEKAIHRLAQAGYAVIYITESMAQAAAEAVARYRAEPFPAIIPIPGSDGPTGQGMKAIRASIEKAVGTDILFGEEGERV